MSDSGMFDKVVEFGMGMAMCQQIPQMMNAATAASSQQAPPPLPKETVYFLAINGQKYGPYTVSQLQQFIPTGQVTGQTLVWCQGMPQWAPASTRPDIAPLFPPVQ